ncbi:hypothetical protein POF50_030105 [Streptomyces sp. SL13]|uniref:Vegetative cell wall protein gp1 n=1 Tax=Streptantibioticus silvisoli TaxID=2705255 RepID=A0AA90KIR2_9ACTN|nr:hypothetical protein [Streptantibioticus silvisoli]MDI5973545.1 hypothetical protein [Streptantibioticus silvisoli]
MGLLLDKIGEKLVDRWLTLLVLPGALFLAVTIAGAALGQSHALDVHRLAAVLTGWARSPAVADLGGQLVLLAATLAGSACASLLARSIGAVLQRGVLGADWRDWPSPLRRVAQRRTATRAARWSEAADAYNALRRLAAAARGAGERADATARRAALHAMMRIAAEAPDRPTWSGDRVHAAAVRLDRDHAIELDVVWPHLWLVLPDSTRDAVTAAASGLDQATVLGGWALLLAPVGWWWWPALPIAAAFAAVCRHRVRAGADLYAQLLEAAVRVHAGELAAQLGLDHAGPLDAALGEDLTRLLLTRVPPPPPAA